MTDKQAIGIAGLGLIGGSFALNMLEHGHAVVGYDCDAQACQQAMNHGVVHQASTDNSVLDDCQAILLAVPVGSLPTVMQQLAKLDMPNLCAIFDAGSTKQKPLAWAAEHLGKYAAQFVACHPIAGKEHSGVSAAQVGLFRGRSVILCEPPASAAAALVRQLWQQCGSELKTMSAADHDHTFATVSHLPHMLAYMLVNLLGARPDRDELLSHAASGFADFTRIASSDPDMWRDVCLSNSQNILAELGAYRNELQRLSEFIAADNQSSIHDYFAQARNLRDNWLAKRKAS